MTLEHVSHKEISDFADRTVNLKREDAKKYRDQVNGLRDRLDEKLKADSDFELRRMLLSGSLAKHTALKQINDIDVALYVQQDNPPSEMPKFIDRLVQILRSLYSNMEPEQITPQEYSIGISFRGTGLDVDIVPISYNGNEQWDGYLYSKRTGKWLMTNIDKHLSFIKRRNENHPNFLQVVRLLKYWVRNIKKGDDDFRFKSFLVELILAHLADNSKIQFDDYVKSLESFFNYISSSNLEEEIIFGDYYSSDQVISGNESVRIFDPVNPDNNAAKGYGVRERQSIVDAAYDAAEAIAGALHGDGKTETVRYWRKIFGSSFEA